MIDNQSRVGDGRDPAVAGSRSQAALIRRVRRVEGQVQGLQRMIEAGRDRLDILTLIAQARGGLHSIGTIVLEDHLIATLDGARSAPDPGDRDRWFSRLVKVFKSWRA